MDPTLRILLFATIMMSLLATGHYYLYRRFIKDTAVPPPYRRILISLLLILMAAFPLTMATFREFSRETMQPFAYLAFIWLGLLSTFFWLLLLGDGAAFVFTRARALRAQDVPPAQPERRITLKRLFAGGVVAGGSAVGAVAVGQALEGFKVVHVDVTLDDLPRAFDGFVIVQMSDVHVGPTIGRPFIEKMVAAANRLEPDLVAITGDLVDGSVENLGKHTAPLQDLTSIHGSYFVTGNHEYYSGAEEWVAELRRLGISVLKNEAHRIERNGESFLLAGVNDHRAGDYGEAPDLKRALQERRPGEEVVLLAHQPRELTAAVAENVGLQLSGHTHGGQFWPWNWFVYLVQPVVAGLARFGRTQVYVNSGTGYWGPPMRMGTEAEITRVTLRSGRASVA